MTHSGKNLLNSASTLLCLISVALLTACGQSGTDTASSPQKTAQTTQTASTTSPAQASDLLASLAATYPNGQLPAANTAQAAQAAKELAQNPAALKLTAQSAPPTTQPAAQSTNTPIQAQATSADYKAVTRIQNTTLTGAYFFTIYDAEKTTALANNPNWKLEGTAFIASVAPDATLDPVHRFRNKLNGSYLYTIYDTEKADITANYASTFVYEGIAWYAQKTPSAGWSPLYRFRNLLNGTYLFSAYEEEKVSIEANYAALFKLEGVAYYVTLPCKAAATAATGYSLVFKGCDATNLATYYDKSECVKDNATGLIWQGQTPAGTGLRGNDQYKTNFDSTLDAQIWNGENPPTRPTQAQVDTPSNSIGFKNAVNSANLCGFSNWRMPAVNELVGLSNSLQTEGFIHPWFPNIQLTYYWTSTPYIDEQGSGYSGSPIVAWMVDIRYAGRQPGLRDHGFGKYGYDYYGVLLVR